MKKGTLACGEDDVRLPFYLPMETEILLSLERDELSCLWNKDLEKNLILPGKKIILLPVERGVLNCLWKEI